MLFWACERSVNWDLETEEEVRLVVEAILTDEYSIQTLRLSQSYQDLNATIPSVNNAVVSVEANGIVYPFIPDSLNDGSYVSQDSFAVLSDLDYRLNIDWEGKTYTANSRLSTVSPMPEITFIPFGQSDSLRLGNFVPIYNASQQSMYEVNIDWSFINDENPNKAKLYLFTFSSVHISEFNGPQTETIFFPKGSQVIVKKYGMNEEFAEFMRSNAIETIWNGRIFYSNGENLPSNISNNGLGFFTTCAVITETIFAE